MTSSRKEVKPECHIRSSEHIRCHNESLVDSGFITPNSRYYTNRSLLESKDPELRLTLHFRGDNQITDLTPVPELMGAPSQQLSYL